MSNIDVSNIVSIGYGFYLQEYFGCEEVDNQPTVESMTFTSVAASYMFFGELTGY
jgi:hypothetical protein